MSTMMLKEDHIEATKVPLLPPVDESASDASVPPSKCFMCRICLIEESVKDSLVSPCRCSGTMAYVHQSCVKEWIFTSEATSCEVCDYKYTVEYSLIPFMKLKFSGISLHDWHSYMSLCPLITTVICIGSTFALGFYGLIMCLEEDQCYKLGSEPLCLGGMIAIGIVLCVGINPSIFKNNLAIQNAPVFHGKWKKKK